MTRTLSSNFRKLAGMGCSSSFRLVPVVWPGTGEGREVRREGGREGGDGRGGRKRMRERGRREKVS